MSNIAETIRRKQETDRLSALNSIKINSLSKKTPIDKKEDFEPKETLEQILNETTLPQLFKDIEKELIAPHYPQHVILTNYETNGYGGMHGSRYAEISLVWGNNDFSIINSDPNHQNIKNNIKEVITHAEKRDIKHFLSKKIDHEIIPTDYACNYCSIEALVQQNGEDNGAIVFKNTGAWINKILNGPVAKGEPSMFNFSKNNILSNEEYTYRLVGKQGNFIRTPGLTIEEEKTIAIREEMLLYDPDNDNEIIILRPVWENNKNIITDVVTNLFMYPHIVKHHRNIEEEWLREKVERAEWERYKDPPY